MEPDSPSLLYKIVFQKYPPVPQAWRAQRAGEDTTAQIPTPSLSPSCRHVLTVHTMCLKISIVNKRKEKGKGVSSISRQNAWLQCFQQQKDKFTFIMFFMKCLLSRETLGLEMWEVCCRHVTSVYPRRQDLCFSGFQSFSMGCPSQPQVVFCGAPAPMSLVKYHFPSPGGQNSVLPGVLVFASEMTRTVGSITCVKYRSCNV